MIVADGGILMVGGLAAEELAERYGTPAYLYDAETIRATYREVRDSFRYTPTRIHFAAVCNPNLQLLRILRDEGAGLHANTPGDVFCGLRAGFRAEDIVFSGSNVNEADLRFLAGTGVAINLDSLDDLRRAVAVAPGRAFGVRIHLEEVLPESRIGLREHEVDEALAIAARAGCRLDSVHIYCGTHGRSLDRYRRAIERLLLHAARLPDLACVNLGGGFGYDYHDSTATFPFRTLADIVEGGVAALGSSLGRTLTLRAEPGRALVAGAGVLLTRVLSVKRGAKRRYLGLDTTVANFTSPAVHGRQRRVVAVGARPPASEPADLCGCTTYSRDVIAHDVPLGELRVGDLVAVLDSGAYGYCMAGHFLNRPSPPELFVDRGVVTVATRRETMEDLIRLQGP